MNEMKELRQRLNWNCLRSATKHKDLSFYRNTKFLNHFEGHVETEKMVIEDKCQIII